MSRQFVERTSAPSKDDRNIIHYNDGGLSICAKIDGKYTMPNCVGYCYARLAELDYPDNAQNHKIDWDIPAGNPNTWIATAKKNGYKTGNEPKFGAVAVFENHVASVEKIYDNGDILVSQSHYNTKVNWDTQLVTKASGYSWNGQKFSGFVYPKTEYVGQITPTNVAEDLYASKVPERFKVKVNGKQTGSYTSYKNAVNAANKNGGVIIDSTNGNQVYPSAVASAPQAQPTAPQKKELNEKSYPDYKGGGFYRVRTSFKDEKSSVGSFSVWKNAYTKWTIYRGLGYHIYDKEGNQLD